MGVSGPIEVPEAEMPKRVALLFTEGWERTVDDAKEALLDARIRMESAGVEVLDRTGNDRVAELETSIEGAVELSGGLNNWDFRWPLNTYAKDIDINGLSPEAQQRLVAAEAMSLEDYQALVLKRKLLRLSYDELQDEFDACVTLSAPGPAPLGLDWTGDAVFAVPSSVLGTPSYSLPVLEAEGLPLGLQVMGYADQDAKAFSAARALLSLYD
jgi:Asp-tRNA(Asn)/Glu-tRNA(Gln) amidotransferase A subunit family amidase